MAIAKRVAMTAFREDPFVVRFRVRGYNLTGAIQRFAVRLYPDEPGDARIQVGNTDTRGAEGIRVVETGVEGLFPWTDVEVILAKDSVRSLPEASEAGSDVKFAYDYEWQRPDTGSGFSEEEETILYGDFVVRGSVNND